MSALMSPIFLMKYFVIQCLEESMPVADFKLSRRPKY